MEDIITSLKRIVGESCRENIPLSRYTSFMTGGKARYIVSPSSLKKLKISCCYAGILACR